jgi:hypothetical protein
LYQAVDACHARCVVILGNAHTLSIADTDQAGNTGELDLHSDLYIILTALELDSMLKVFLRRRGGKHRARDRVLTTSGAADTRHDDMLSRSVGSSRTNNLHSSGDEDDNDYFIPVVIQEVYCESSMSFLSDDLTLSHESAAIWDTSFFNTSLSLSSSAGSSSRRDSFKRTASAGKLKANEARRSLSADNAYVLMRMTAADVSRDIDSAASDITAIKPPVPVSDGASGNATSVSAFAQVICMHANIIGSL